MSLIIQNELNLNVTQNEFENRLSKRPFCSDNLKYGLQIRDKQVALSKKYIQANTPFNFSWFCFDVDYPNVLETTFRDNFLPAPNIIIINPENNHSHLLYGINNQIHLTDNAKIDPIRYAHAIQYALREALKADTGYTGLIIKNPGHSAWNTIELETKLWNLNQLADYCILPTKMPKRESLIGLGRNCTLFELSRKFAYSEVLKYRTKDNKDYFYNSVLDFIEQQNTEFPQPLMLSEYKGIAKSVSNWSWRYYGNKTTKQWVMYVKRTHNVDIQRKRGRLGGLANTSQSQSIKGKIGGSHNTSEVQSIKGKIGAAKSAQVRYEGSAEQLKPWKELRISRSWYYTQKSIGAI